jgi:hypothetical protein
LLGWHITVYRQQDGGSAPAQFGAPQGARLAVWQTGQRGLNWIKDLVSKGEALSLGGDGYPMEYTAKASQVLPVIQDEPPEARPVWSLGVGDIIDPEKWLGKTTRYLEAINDCNPEEWLLIQAWDES